jgi:hypothetical protein
MFTLEIYIFALSIVDFLFFFLEVDCNVDDDGHVGVPCIAVICPQTSMSTTPSTDTDPWDRPLDVSG